MGTVFLHGNGGSGGGGINFRVIGGTSAPSNPKENDIWVNTDTEITFTSFCPVDPGPVMNGLVWIATGTSGVIGFNALKKNAMVVFPTFAQQCVNGKMVDKTAKIYQGSAWVDFKPPKIVFHDTDADLAVSGGYSMTHIGDSVGWSNVSIQDNGVIKSYTKEGGNSWWFSNNAVDLTRYSTIAFTFEGNSTTGNYAHTSRLGIAKTRGTSFESYVSTDKSGIVTVTLDVSGLEGMYYIGGYGATMSSAANNLYVYAIIIE